MKFFNESCEPIFSIAKRLVFLSALLLVAAGCSGGGGGGSSGSGAPTTPLTWDAGTWDQVRWN